MTTKEYLFTMLKRGAVVLLIVAVLCGGAYLIGRLRGPQPRECPRCGLKQTAFTDCPFCDQEICTSCAADYEVYAVEYLEDLGYTVISP